MKSFPSKYTPLSGVSDRSERIAKDTLIVCGVVTVVSVVLGLLFLLHTVVVEIIIALVLAVALEPLTQLFVKRKIERTWAVFLAVLIGLVAFLVILGAIVTPFVTEGAKLASEGSSVFDQFTQNPTIAHLNDKYHIVTQAKELFVGGLRSMNTTSLPIIGVFGSIFDGASSLAIIIVLAFFLLLEGPDFWDRGLNFFRPERAAHFHRAAKKMMIAVSGFVTGNMLISLFAGAVALITLLALHVPYALALAIMLALFDLIPLVGAALGTIIIALVTLTQGLPATIIVVIVMLVYQLIEGHVIQPLVYSRIISLSPLLIILATIIGAELGGIIGVLLAIPVAAVIQIGLREFVFAELTSENIE